MAVPGRTPECSVLVEGTASRPETTCGPVDFRGFAIETKRTFVHTPVETGYLSSPVAAPILDSGTSVFVASKISDDGDALRDLLAVDGSSGELEAVFGVSEAEPRHLAAARDRDGHPSIYISEWGDGWAPTQVYSLATDVAVARAVGINGRGGMGTGTRDIDHDGRADVFVSDVVALHDGGVLYEGSPVDMTVLPTLFDSDGVGHLAYATADGLADLSSGDFHPWPWSESDGYAAGTAVAGGNGGPVTVTVSDRGILIADGLGSIELTPMRPGHDVPFTAYPAAVGDIDGDGAPEAVVGVWEEIWAVALVGPSRGDVVHRWVVTPPEVEAGWASHKAVVLADLDADRVYEVVSMGPDGLHVLSALHAESSVAFLDIGSLAVWNWPIVADIDADGSAEIVVTGTQVPAGEHLWAQRNEYVAAGTYNSTLFILGAAEGEWARTRPIWNQVPYDITTVRDDGTIVRFPRPSWSQYNAFRAQPAHDGDHPDLSPRVTAACADSCDEDGTITLTVVVDNLGSVDAPAGADLVLSTWAQGEPWIDEALRITLPDPVPAGGQSPEYAFSMPVSQWKDARVLDVWGTHEDECDYVNDRIDVAEDPCPPD